MSFLISCSAYVKRFVNLSKQMTPIYTQNVLNYDGSIEIKWYQNYWWISTNHIFQTEGPWTILLICHKPMNIYYQVLYLKTVYWQNLNKYFYVEIRSLSKDYVYLNIIYYPRKIYIKIITIFCIKNIFTDIHKESK